MSSNLEKDVAAWIGEGRTIESNVADCVVSMARAVLFDFWSSYPAHKTEDDTEAMAILGAMAKAAGFECVERFVGSARCTHDGRMVLELGRLSLPAGGRV